MDNSQLYCKAVFTYSNESIPDQMKHLAEYFFMEARNKAVDLLNPHYEEWNAEYNKDVNGEDDCEYNAFIQSKHNDILTEFNKSHPEIPIELYSDEDADIAGRFKYYGNVIEMHMGIKLLNEKEYFENLRKRA